MGIAIRTGSPLGLHLAEGVWRQLGGQALRPRDLAEVDAGFLPALLCIRDMAPDHNVRPCYLYIMSTQLKRDCTLWHFGTLLVTSELLVSQSTAIIVTMVVSSV